MAVVVLMPLTSDGLTLFLRLHKQRMNRVFIGRNLSGIWRQFVGQDEDRKRSFLAGFDIIKWIVGAVVAFHDYR